MCAQTKTLLSDAALHPIRDYNIRFCFECIQRIWWFVLVLIAGKVFGIFVEWENCLAFGTLKTCSWSVRSSPEPNAHNFPKGHTPKKKEKKNRRKSICELKIFRSWSHAPIHYRITGYGKQIWYFCCPSKCVLVDCGRALCITNDFFFPLLSIENVTTIQERGAQKLLLL